MTNRDGSWRYCAPLYSVCASQKAQLVQQSLRRTLKNHRLGKEYNEVRPHNSLDHRMPNEFARTLSYGEAENAYGAFA